MIRKLLIVGVILFAVSFRAKADITSSFYRGMIGLERGFFLSEKYDEYKDLSLTTTHGYQFNQHLFLGVGANFLLTQSWKNISIPVFASARTDWSFNKLTPYAEFRAGAYLGHINGLYLSPIIGYRFNLSKIFSLNVGVGGPLFLLMKTIIEIICI